MIKCPQCSYHNVDNHRFCQQCGTSLTQKQCAKCGHLVDLEATHCSQCQHLTATIWWTLLTSTMVEPEPFVTDNTAPIAVPITASQTSNLSAFESELDADSSTQELLDTIEQLVNPSKELETTVDLARTSEPAIAALQQRSANTPRHYLSPLQTNPVIQRFLAENPRYQLLEASTTQPSPPLQPGRYEFSILDTQPFQISPLAVMLSQLQGAIGAAEISQPGIIMTFLETQPLPFPPLLEPYLALRQQFPLFLPYVHDAWQSGQQSIVLLEDRTGLPTVKEVLASGKISAAQILHWMQQTLHFAMVSTPWGCSPSVLHVDNLKVDQSNVLCLQQLLFTQEQSAGFDASRGNGASVQSAIWDDLRHVWLDLLQGLGTTLGDPLHPLLTHLQATAEVTQTELQSYLSDLSQQLSVAVPAAGDERGQQQAAVPDNDGATPTLILPNQLIHLAAAGQTDDGRDRHHNEDFFVIEQQLQQCINPHQHHVSGRGLYILCDGMGGHAGGEIASSLAAETLTQYLKTHWQEDLPDAQTLKDAIGAANDALFQVNEEKAGSNRMGTTLIMALVQDTHIHIAHVGDSRLYRLTHQYSLEQMTTDHEVGQREMHRGTAPEVAYARPDAFQLTQALGPRESEVLKPDIQLLTATEDTLLLICSDGLTDNQLLETHGDQFLQPMLNSQMTLQHGVNELISLANQHNGHDNITVIAILMRVQPQQMSSR